MLQLPPPGGVLLSDSAKHLHYPAGGSQANPNRQGLPEPETAFRTAATRSKPDGQS